MWLFYPCPIVFRHTRKTFILFLFISIIFFFVRFVTIAATSTHLHCKAYNFPFFYTFFRQLEKYEILLLVTIVLLLWVDCKIYKSLQQLKCWWFQMMNRMSVISKISKREIFFRFSFTIRKTRFRALCSICCCVDVHAIYLTRGISLWHSCHLTSSFWCARSAYLHSAFDRKL